MYIYDMILVQMKNVCKMHSVIQVVTRPSHELKPFTAIAVKAIMPKTISGNNPHRKKFEEVYGKSIRHDSWLQICHEIKDAGLKVDMKTVSFYAKFKKIRPRTLITKEVINKLNNFSSAYKENWSGRELYSLIKQNTDLSNNAAYKPFYKANLSFGTETVYSFEQAYLVLTFAYTIRPKKEE